MDRSDPIAPLFPIGDKAKRQNVVRWAGNSGHCVKSSVVNELHSLVPKVWRRIEGISSIVGSIIAWSVSPHEPRLGGLVPKQLHVGSGS